MESFVIRMRIRGKRRKTKKKKRIEKGEAYRNGKWNYVFIYLLRIVSNGVRRRDGETLDFDVHDAACRNKQRKRKKEKINKK